MKIEEFIEYSQLEDVPLPSIGYWDPIEDNIEDLVRSLQSINVLTVASCEGHLHYKGHQHPWIGINTYSYNSVKALKILLDKYNESHELDWELPHNSLLPVNIKCSPNNVGVSLPCKYGEDFIQGKKGTVILRNLQESGNNLANYIFKHRKDKEIIDLVLNPVW